MRRTTYLIGFISVIFCAQALAQPTASKLTGRRGLVYAGKPENGVLSGPALYQIEFKEWDDAQTGVPTRVESSTQDLSTKNTTSHQEVAYRNGVAEHWTISRPDLKMDALVERRDGRVWLKLTRDGKTDHADEADEQNPEMPLLLGPVMGRYLRENLSRLKSGETLKTQFYAVSRKTSYGFEVSATPSPAGWMSLSSPQKDWLHVVFKPTSFIIAVLAPALHIWLDSKNGQLRAYQGPLESRVAGSDAMLDGTVFYTPFSE